MQLSMMDAPFLRNAWYVAGWASEFESGRPAGMMIINEPVVLYRKSNGALVALEDRCAHRWVPLSMGRVEGDDLRCMYHGVKYGADGRCVEVPGQDRSSAALRVRSYPAIDKYCLAWIWMGDPALADEELIPDLSVMEQPWRLYRGALDYEAHYSLVNDNLLDLSHIAFLHERTIGRPVETSAGILPKPRVPSGSGAKSIALGVRVEGWRASSLSRTVVLPKNVPDGDLWSRVDFIVPGVYSSRLRIYPHGTAELCRGAAPEAVQTAAFYDGISVQVVTPVAARKTRYLYSLGFRDSDLQQQESDEIWSIVLEAFSEDLQMIHAQQRVIDVYPGRRMGGIASDRGSVIFRNLMKKLIAAEASQPEPKNDAGVPSGLSTL